MIIEIVRKRHITFGYIEDETAERTIKNVETVDIQKHFIVYNQVGASSPKAILMDRENYTYRIKMEE